MAALVSSFQDHHVNLIDEQRKLIESSKVSIVVDIRDCIYWTEIGNLSRDTRLSIVSNICGIVTDILLQNELLEEQRKCFTNHKAPAGYRNEV